MKLYNAKIIVQGQRAVEAMRWGVTAAEIDILREIHGPDSVLKITKAGNLVISAEDLRDKLRRDYGDAVVAKVHGLGGRAKLIEELPEDEIGVDPLDELTKIKAELDELKAAAGKAAEPDPAQLDLDAFDASGAVKSPQAKKVELELEE